MKRLVFLNGAAICFLFGLVISAIAQDSVPIEKEPMHRLKFANEFVRLFDVLVPVGKSTLYHIHSHDGIGVRVSDAQIVDESMSGEKQPLDMKYGVVTFAARPSPQTHRVVNNGMTDFRNIFIEILSPQMRRQQDRFRSFRTAKSSLSTMNVCV